MFRSQLIQCRSFLTVRPELRIDWSQGASIPVAAALAWRYSTWAKKARHLRAMDLRRPFSVSAQ